MRRLLLTASISALLLLTLGQSAQSDLASDSASAPPIVGVANVSAENNSTQAVSFNVSQNAAPASPANWNDGRPIVVIQHNIPANIDLKARPRIASDLAVALREPSFAVFATAIVAVYGIAFGLVLRNSR